MNDAIGRHNYQIVQVRSPVGVQKAKAPSGFDFDKITSIVWVKLCDQQSDLCFKPPKTKRETRYLEGKIDALSNVLSNALGMSTFYWEQASHKAVRCFYTEGWIEIND